MPARMGPGPDTGVPSNSSRVQPAGTQPSHHPVWQHVQLVGISRENRSNLAVGNENPVSLRLSENGSVQERRAVLIPPLTLHASRSVRSPALDHRVPSPAPSLSSNNSSRSDPLARAGGVPMTDDPLMPEVPVQVVNTLNDQRLDQRNRNAHRDGPFQAGAPGMPCRLNL